MNKRYSIIVSLSVVGILFIIFQISNLKSYWSGFLPTESILNDTIAGTSYHTENSTILILYWSSVFGRKVNVTGIDGKYKFPFFAVSDKCPVKCELTSNKSRIAEASAIVIHGRDAEEMPPASSRHNTVPWIFHANENPVFTKALRNGDIMQKFSYSASYRLDSDFPCPQFYKPKLTRPVAFAKKTGLSVAVYSHCEKTRTLYLHRLMKHMPIDFYGKCMRTMPVLPRTKDNHGFLVGIMSKYKFAFVFPNADCDYYMTEKIYIALSSGAVPVWMGTDTIDEVLKWGNLKTSVIKVRDFKSPRQLAKHLLWLSRNEAEYNKFLKWKYEGFNFPREYYESRIAEWWEGSPLFCQVCMRLAQTNRSVWRRLDVDNCDGRQRRTLEKWIRE
ncbi:alpha-(1,3)-fucosyltransferase 11-like [Dendronephthya gigantea]|uniref:alpha-(1,3)-fucosyltransferase 11-like n=1 Tax=Dendronephthya gigantea TaxID=151771 RepID=UPI00106CD517|nr:alpha-(1,3)-fucosyltransferase 11-like [Dendronephthya gigantea]